MTTKRQYAIREKQPLSVAIFQFEWSRGLLVEEQEQYRFDKPDRESVALAKTLTGAQICVSTVALLATLLTENTLEQGSAIFAFLYSLLALSSATRNTTDALSSFLLSPVSDNELNPFNQYSKLHTALYFGWITAMADNACIITLMGAIALLIGIDALVGIQILFERYIGELEDVHPLTQNLIEKRQARRMIVPNERLPEILSSNELLIKLSCRGWKIDAFNADKEVGKLITAIVVIFALLYTSMSSMVMGAATNPVAIFTCIYALASLWSFLNIAEVRDATAISRNITPLILLTLTSAYVLTHSRNIMIDLMGAVLLADCYFAFAYEEEEEEECEKSTMEKLCMTSWTQGVFSRVDSLSFQIVGLSFIFAQLFLAMSGLIALGSTAQGLFLGFYISRLINYFSSELRGVHLAQSNMACVFLAVIGLSQIFGYGYLATCQSILTITDAYIGIAVMTMDSAGKAQSLRNHVKLTLSRLSQSLGQLGGAASSVGEDDDKFKKI